MVRLFRRKDAAPSVTTVTATLLNGGQKRVEVVGESQFQVTIKDVMKNLLRNGEIYEGHAMLVPEPENKHDKNAIAVYLDGGNKVGYLSRDDAIAYQPLVQELKRRKTMGACRAIIAGGTTEKPNFGVFLDLAAPEDALSDDDENDR